MTIDKELIAAGVGAYVAKDIILKVFGPTADYLGQETKGLVEKCNVNISNIIKKAFAKIKHDETDKIVNIRAFKDIVNEGKMIEDDIFADYFAGLLASSRSYDGKDDRAVYYVNLIKSLSSYQIKIHFLVYSKLLESLKEDFFDIRKLSIRENIKIYVPQNLIQELYRCHSEEIFLYSTHALSGLSEKSLISKQSIFFSEYKDKGFLFPGIICGPTILGVELFLLVNGMNKIGINELTQKNLEKVPLSDAITMLDIQKMQLLR